ncbi:MAG: carboxylating nicotinate-nucleotide diphosphorylase [Limnobacter sp.]|nr:carboxylating nicotinate-nucleotide diphosphorylase [Limnobacter sp.]
MKHNDWFNGFGAPLQEALTRNVKEAIAEDLGHCDYTGLLIEPETQCRARLLCRESAVVCGQPWFDEVFAMVEPQARLQWLVSEGEQVQPNTVVCEVTGPARGLMTAERPAMNFLQTLSAVATKTRFLSELTRGTRAKLLDTRKTIPGLRLAQKYAVKVGGGENQRLALYDGILIKENHIAAAGGIAQALSRASEVADPGVGIQIEVESLEQLEEALSAGAQSILLDNFSLELMRQAVTLNDHRALLEASGGINESTLTAIAQTGVDRISVGALTKDIKAVDYSFRVLT